MKKNKWMKKHETIAPHRRDTRLLPSGHKTLDRGGILDQFLRRYNSARPVKSRFKASWQLLGLTSWQAFVEDFMRDPEDYVYRLRKAFLDDDRAESWKCQGICELIRFANWLWERGSLVDESGHRQPLPQIHSPATNVAECVQLGETLTLDEIQRIEASILRQPSPIKERDHLLFCCLYYQGLRHDEVLSLRWCDYEPDPRPHGCIGWLRIKAKGKLTRVKAAIAPKTLEAWEAYKNLYAACVEQPEMCHCFISTTRLEQAYYKAMEGGRYHDHCNLGVGLKAISQPTSGKIIRGWGEVVGYVNVHRGNRDNGKRLPLRAHDLRHNAITHLIDAEVPTQDIAAFARHASEYLVKRYDLKTSIRSMKCAEVLGGRRAAIQGQHEGEEKWNT